MIPREAKMKFKRQSHEKERDRKALIAGIAVGLILAVAVGAIIYFYGTRHPL